MRDAADMKANKIVDEILIEKLCDEAFGFRHTKLDDDPINAVAWESARTSFETTMRYVCESPIECQMLSGLIHCSLPVPDAFPLNVISISRDVRGHDKFLTIIPQAEVLGTLRVDFELLFLPSPETEVSVFVECDGHDFHERTKEQAARDRRRDRLFTLNNLTFLRFTGSEIAGDLDGCIREVTQALACEYLRALGRWDEADALVNPERL